LRRLRATLALPGDAGAACRATAHAETARLASPPLAGRGRRGTGCGSGAGAAAAAAAARHALCPRFGAPRGGGGSPGGRRCFRRRERHRCGAAGNERGSRGPRPRRCAPLPDCRRRQRGGCGGGGRPRLPAPSGGRPALLPLAPTPPSPSSLGAHAAERRRATPLEHAFTCAWVLEPGAAAPPSRMLSRGQGGGGTEAPCARHAPTRRARACAPSTLVHTPPAPPARSAAGRLRHLPLLLGDHEDGHRAQPAGGLWGAAGGCCAGGAAGASVSRGRWRGGGVAGCGGRPLGSGMLLGMGAPPCVCGVTTRGS
jgi:hypothetical protein